jgi:hypothetical protein
VPRTLGVLLGVFYIKHKIKAMEIIIGILLAFYLLLLEKVLEMKDRIENLEKIVKLINDDLNMVAQTQKNTKQILKG